MSQTPHPLPVATARPSTDGSTASHIDEFGHGAPIVHVQRNTSQPPHHLPPSHPHTNHSPPPFSHRLRALRRTLFRPRKLLQYFYDGILFRSRESRRLSREELFLDLVLVASIATLGHHLRAQLTWSSIQTFVLLYTAIYSAWREIVIMWNLWGVKEDLIEKIAIYIVFVAITGISVGGIAPFVSSLRPYVSISAFIATLVPIIAISTWASQEPLLKLQANRINQVMLANLFSLFTILPYLAAAFVPSVYAARSLFFAVLCLQPLSLLPAITIYDVLHRKVQKHSRVAFAIGHIVEKLEVLTMIFIGESVISLLSETGSLVLEENVRIERVYLTAIGSTAMLYALQTLYTQVDGWIGRGGIHALRYDQYSGIAWGALHWPYHLSLMLFATGLGVGARDIAVEPTSVTNRHTLSLSLLPSPEGNAINASIAPRSGMEAILRAEESASASGLSGDVQFTLEARWLYAVGWMSSLILSGLIGAMHYGGVKAVSKQWRLGIRFVVAGGIGIGMPFSNVEAGLFMLIFLVVTVALALWEFLLVRCDAVGFWGFERKVRLEGEEGLENEDGEWEEEEEEEGEGGELSDGENEDGNESSDGGEIVDEVEVDWEAGDSSRDGEGEPTGIARTLTRRMGTGRSSRMVAVKRRSIVRRSGRRRRRRVGLG